MFEDPGAIQPIGGLWILRLSSEGPLIRSEAQADAILGEAWGCEADLAAIPVERLAPEFFRLETGLAGRILQKFTTYRLRIAILGEIPAEAAQSKALQAFILESNRGRQIWFLAGAQDLERRLKAAQASGEA